MSIAPISRAIAAAIVFLALAAPARADLTATKTDWHGHEALQVTNGTIELVIVTGIGPRIVRYAFVGGDNVLGEVAADKPGKTTPLGDWYIYGGHRLWIGPEMVPASYAPDNGPVRATVAGNVITLAQPVDKAGIVKMMTVTVAPTGTGVTIAHRIINRSTKAIDASAWALTVMNSGGRVIIPTEPYKSHDDELQPQRTMTLWAYTVMSDPRWTWGKRYIQLRVDASLADSQKIGVSNKQGWAAYLRESLLFVKRYDWTAGAAYPDFGVNTETYTAGPFVELETLGPMKRLTPGQDNTHEERWTLVKDVDAGTTEESLDKALTAALQQAR